MHELNADAQAYWQVWIEGEHSSERFRIYSKPLIENMRLASQREDWQAYRRLLEVFLAVEPFCSTEPLLTDYERGLLSVNYHLADLMAVDGSFDRTLHHIGLIREALIVGDERRAAAGMVERPNSMLRFQCLGLQAICLLANETLFEGVRPLTRTRTMVHEFWELAKGAESYLAEHESHRPGYVQMTMHSMARWEIEVVKLCWRYDRILAERAVELFNQRYGEHLASELCRFEDPKDVDLQSAWFWDFELSKLVSADALTRQRLRICAEQRRAGCRMWVGSGPEPLFEKLWAREVKRLKRLCND